MMEKPQGIKLCSVEGCDRKHVAKGFCQYHYYKDRHLRNPEARAKKTEYVKRYRARPEIRKRELLRRQAQSLAKNIKELGSIDHHSVCKKLGKPYNHIHSNKHYNLRCKICNVSYSDLHPEIFYKNNKCPCCHRLLRRRLGITRKKQLRALD